MNDPSPFKEWGSRTYAEYALFFFASGMFIGLGWWIVVRFLNSYFGP